MLHERVQTLFRREAENAIPQRSDMWYKLRKNLVTASEVGSILGARSKR